MKIETVIAAMNELLAQGETDVAIAWWDRFFVAEAVERRVVSREKWDGLGGIAEAIDDIDWGNVNDRIVSIVEELDQPEVKTRYFQINAKDWAGTPMQIFIRADLSDDWTEDDVMDKVAELYSDYEDIKSFVDPVEIPKEEYEIKTVKSGDPNLYIEWER